jgi:two-component system LytT family sensor kinase
MLLQTLVENAIKHGIAQVSGNGDLIVRAERQDGLICLTVENTGQLSEAPANPSQFGIANTRERLRLLYGDQASLILNNGNGRVIATVQIPA